MMALWLLAGEVQQLKESSSPAAPTTGITLERAFSRVLRASEAGPDRLRCVRAGKWECGALLVRGEVAFIAK